MLNKSSADAVAGFQVAGVHGGLKKDGALDFALLVSECDCVAAGVFTRNKVKAAPVLLDQQRLAENPASIRAVATNSGCANACTGAVGMDNARATASLVADALGIAAEQVLVMSTGVIGAHLPMPAIERGVELSSAALSDDWAAAAAAIMTTDTRPKLVSAQVECAGGSYTIAGMAKGAGMIAPDMATMLSVIATDAALELGDLQHALGAATQQSFNRIVVDGDTSTNDTVLLLANGRSGVTVAGAEDLAAFQAALDKLTRYLAQEIVRDGEGVTKFVTLDIVNAATVADAERIGQTIGASLLTKSAFYGSDANWGRIVAAAGRAGTAFDPNRSSLWVAAGESSSQPGLQIFAGGMPADYQEADAAAIMTEPAMTFRLDCGLGQGSATIWTCDISHEYISINGDYRS
ncbi:MAG: bifunctional glutamate N-acetyltransferase/amino-acid acetyltransferase ArgJ [Chloroflexi bacterium]|nr:bifunctional glutamate N-acetyltransferase/amino-acid acetyltransferase ArgJ [Chloroflexota bacterium]MXX49645.1 bifunctional glutamate N-acetyltransferase/amino-acid acetyltransferase ArgJ [Chloroflexota bacterium]MXX84332.1 bifunctional glutamate N-acetyltransferase/amino-acid acetyltransferase ArgJ [Chloroflexota bacterium]MYA92125.1 bifunctional glutamate N-acetyltransferase/amino-acid acetyltransferase ArgJ [Chloroflexota bacterium]MYC54555.1 bifunctional glutamate N-acetyltransferase/a